jgi:hypothetical protein
MNATYIPEMTPQVFPSSSFAGDFGGNRPTKKKGVVMELILTKIQMRMD